MMAALLMIAPHELCVITGHSWLVEHDVYLQRFVVVRGRGFFGVRLEAVVHITEDELRGFALGERGAFLAMLLERSGAALAAKLERHIESTARRLGQQLPHVRR